MNNSISRPNNFRMRPRRAAVFVASPMACGVLGLLSLAIGAQAQEVPYQATQNPNVEVRHVPNAQVWPGWAKTTRGVNIGKKVPPTITRGPNGVSATLNPTWFSKAKVTRLPSGQLKLSCDENTGSTSAKATKKATTKTSRLLSKTVPRLAQKTAGHR